MKNISFFFLFSFLSTVLFAQDVIVLNDGTELKSIVKEVNSDNIKYLKFNSKDGPIYTKNISEIFMIKYQNGGKDVFNNNYNSNKLFKLPSGELITLYLKESVSSRNLTNGTIVKFAVKEPIVSLNNKLIVASNTIVNGKVTKVTTAKWAGQKGELTIQINSVKAVDGTNIPVYYNLNNQGESKSTEAIGIGVFLFWPALLMKGKSASIEAGTEIVVETISDVIIDDSKFEEYKLEDISTKNISLKVLDDKNKNTPQTVTVFRPKKQDFDRKSDYRQALQSFYQKRKKYEPNKEDFKTKSDYKKAMKAYYVSNDYFKFLD